MSKFCGDEAIECHLKASNGMRQTTQPFNLQAWLRRLRNKSSLWC